MCCQRFRCGLNIRPTQGQVQGSEGSQVSGQSQGGSLLTGGGGRGGGRRGGRGGGRGGTGGCANLPGRAFEHSELNRF